MNQSVCRDASIMFKKTLSNIVALDPQSMEAFLGCFTPQKQEKGDFFAKKGIYSKHIAFVQSGVLRAFYRNNKGREYNKTFFTENNFVGGYSSLITEQKNRIDIECLTDCVLLVAPYKDIIGLYDIHPKIERLARVLAEQFFVRKEKREIELVTLEAKDRYVIFRQEHPSLEQLIPQYHIASYLGISPTQLSRIRAQK